jgi:hypothetical protein
MSGDGWVGINHGDLCRNELETCPDVAVQFPQQNPTRSFHFLKPIVYRSALDGSVRAVHRVGGAR